jgi:hypothetical protein
LAANDKEGQSEEAHTSPKFEIHFSNSYQLLRQRKQAALATRAKGQ